MGLILTDWRRCGTGNGSDLRMGGVQGKITSSELLIPKYPLFTQAILPKIDRGYESSRGRRRVKPE